MASKTSTRPVGIQCEPVLGVRNVYKYSKKGSTTEAYVIDRESLSKSIPIKELQYPGIYFLIGDALDGSDIRNVYVGKAGLHNSKNKDENQAILGRLRQHDTSKTERYRDLWKFAVAITQYSVEKTSGSTAELYGSWGLTEVSNLENIFYHNLPSNCKLNSAEPNLGSDFHDNTDYSGLVAQIKELLVASGSIDFDEGVNLQETGVYDAAEQVEPVEQKEQKESVKTTVKESAVTTNINPLASVPEYTTPKKTVRQVEDCINPELLNPNTTFIDLACKGGEFLKELYNRLMQAESLIAEFPNEFARSAHILSNQLYGVALSNVSADKARRNLLGYGKNIVTIPNYISILKASYGTAARRAKQFGLAYEHTDIKDVFSKLFKTESGDPVKFDVVIGNPPYQEDTGGGSSGAMPLYDKFVLAANDLANKCFSLIIPSRWFVSSRSECAAVRDVLLTDNTKYIRDFKDASTVFNGVQIAGGVCYFVVDKQYNGTCTVDTGADKWEETLDKSMLIRNKVVSSVFSKIKAHGDFNVLTTQKMNAFGLKRAECGSAKHSSDTEIKVHSSGLYAGWIERSEIYKGTDLIDKYNVITDYGTSGVNITFRIGMIKPGEVCTLTYYVIRSFDTEEEALNCIKYLRTRFVKFMIEATICNATITDKNFVLVPNQNFGVDGTQDIDWSQSLDEVDEQLFKKYKLSDDEVAYIKKTIKPTV